MTDEKEDAQKECPSQIGYVSWEEEFVLKRMRELKEKAAELKARIARLSKEPDKKDELRAAHARLEGLKEDFRKLEKERDQARDDKMRALGHLE